MRKQSVLMAEEALAETIVGAPIQGARRLQRAKKMGTWMMLQLSTLNVTELGTQEWRDVLFL